MSVITQTPPQAPPEPVEDKEAPFGPNEMRLGKRQWIFFLAVMFVIVIFTPWIWSKAEKFETGGDYRIPYDLSNDYWQIGRWFQRTADDGKIPVIGDSVIWGEYVSPDGTLTHFLNRKADTFANCGVNGFFPLALEGLVEHYGKSMRDTRVILECDVLWMTSPKSDLSSAKADAFNHSRLVPQFRMKIPSYRADANERIGAVIERNFGFFSWASHIQIAYFGQQSIPQWTLAEDGEYPPNYPNLWKNPLAQITMSVPGGPASDPDRGVSSPRHVPWYESGKEPLHYDWVGLDESLQWQAFQRTYKTLKSRGNSVYVVVVPFNEHMVAEDNREAFHKIVVGIDGWLTQNDVPHYLPPTLPRELYADASHPLTAGYAALADNIFAQPSFEAWLNGR